MLRFCCQCCCRCCCVRPHPSPETLLAGRKMLVLRVLIVALSAGVIASCAYGMKQVEPQLVADGIALLNSVEVCGSASPCQHAVHVPTGHLCSVHAHEALCPTQARK